MMRMMTHLLFVALLGTSVLPRAALAQWRYEYQYDEVRDYQRQFATLKSANQINFGSPYQGGSRMAVVLRRGQFGEMAVLLTVDRGQFACSGECRFSMRFDDEEASFGLNRAADGSTNVMFVDNDTEFLRMLANTKRLLMEATFSREGNRVFTFNVQPLRWPPLPDRSKKR